RPAAVGETGGRRGGATRGHSCRRIAPLTEPTRHRWPGTDTCDPLPHVWCAPRATLRLPPRCRPESGRGAELVALRVLHQPPVACRSLVELLNPPRAQRLEPIHQRVQSLFARVYVDVQPVLDRLALRYVLEQDPAAPSDAGHLVERVVRVPDRGETAEILAITVFDHRGFRQLTAREQLVDQRAGIFHLVAERRRPEIGDGGSVPAVYDQLPVQCHTAVIAAGTDSLTGSRAVPVRRVAEQSHRRAVVGEHRDHVRVELLAALRGP